MRKSVIVFLGLVSMPLLAAQKPAGPAISGQWTATFADSVSSGTLSITLHSAANGKVSGTYNATSGGFGTIAGNLTGSTLQFTLTQTVKTCPGSYTGIVNLAGDHGTGVYSGSDCLGKHDRGVISFARATVSTAAAAQPAPKTPASRKWAKFIASLPPGTFWWSKSDCSYCHFVYAGGVPFEVLTTPDEVVAATMGRHGSLWYGSIIVIDESTHQVDVLRKHIFLRLIERKGPGEKAIFAKIVSPRRVARQRGKRFALAFFSALAMSAPTYSQTNISGNATTTGYGGNTYTTFNGTASTYTYGGANKVLAYANYLRGLRAMRERANWIEAASLKDTSLFHGQSTHGLLWFKGDKHAVVSELMARIDGKTFVFGWLNGKHR